VKNKKKGEPDRQNRVGKKGVTPPRATTRPCSYPPKGQKLFVERELMDAPHPKQETERSSIHFPIEGDLGSSAPKGAIKRVNSGGKGIVMIWIFSEKES